MDVTTGGRGRKATAEDVARRIGVSRSTVSRALTPGSVVAARTRERILRAADELGYRPNALARALISRRSRLVGIVTGDLSNPYHAVIQDRITEALQARGLVPMSLKVTPDHSIEEIVPVLTQYQVACVVLTSIVVTAAMVEACQRVALPVVLVNRVAPDVPARAICADLEQGGQLAARHLVARGCQRIALVRGLAGTWTSEARERGFRRGLREAGLSVAVSAAGDYTYDGGAAAATELLGDGAPPDGVFCANDLTALGFIDAARERGFAAPEAFAVIGFDDIPMAAWSAYGLTTVRLPTGDMIGETTEHLMAIVNGAESRPGTTLIPCELVQRRT